MEQTSFADSSGVRWSVSEDGADDARLLANDALPGTTWLRFESDREVRRLWHYPDDWRWLNPVQLETLLDRASTVIARFRPAQRHARVDVPPGSGVDRTADSADASPTLRREVPRPDGPSGEPQGR